MPRKSNVELEINLIYAFFLGINCLNIKGLRYNSKI